MLQWLFWQMGGLGPMAGTEPPFPQYAPEKIPYAIDRYVKETNRLYGVLDKRLADRDFIAGDYSIADMASYPWIVPYERQGQNLDDFPHLKRWFEAIKARPGDGARLASAPRSIQTVPRDQPRRRARSSSARPRARCGVARRRRAASSSEAASAVAQATARAAR